MVKLKRGKKLIISIMCLMLCALACFSFVYVSYTSTDNATLNASSDLYDYSEEIAQASFFSEADISASKAIINSTGLKFKINTINQLEIFAILMAKGGSKDETTAQTYFR